MPDIISVSALNRYVRSLLESDEALADIALRGEVSNFVRNAKTGHCYFSLKDDKASVKAILFRAEAERQGFLPENGMAVVARGRVSLYERDGAFQLYAEFLFPDGQGAAQLAFEQLKARLEAEGLFAPEAKQPLPPWPGKVGLVTSKTGAALQDILNVARRRWPVAEFLLTPVRVQGAEAAGEIAAAIAALDATGEAEVIIVARGGGSAEDLWVFNAEAVARAAFAARVPVVSAIGHETDYTILDFVADLRAPTPSAAAELVLPDGDELLGRLIHLYTNLANNMQFCLHSCYNDLKRAAAAPAFGTARRAVARREASLHQLGAELCRAQGLGLKAQGRRLAACCALAESLSPHAVLARGYGIASAGGRPLQSVGQMAAGDAFALSLKDGRLDCRVENIVKGGDEAWRIN